MGFFRQRQKRINIEKQVGERVLGCSRLKRWFIVAATDTIVMNGMFIKKRYGEYRRKAETINGTAHNKNGTKLQV